MTTTPPAAPAPRRSMQCSMCKGSGLISGIDLDNQPVEVRCQICHGTGSIMAPEPRRPGVVYMEPNMVAAPAPYGRGR